MHGTEDPTVPFQGGFASVPPPLNSFSLPAVADVIDAWRDSNNCVGEPSITQLPNLNTQDGAVMPEPVPGDYNQNGEVDAADYVVWRNGIGTTYAQGDYDVWRAHFGQAGSEVAGYTLGASAKPLSAAVPEPTTLLVLLVGALEAYCYQRKRR